MLPPVQARDGAEQADSLLRLVLEHQRCKNTEGMDKTLERLVEIQVRVEAFSSWLTSEKEDARAKLFPDIKESEL